MENNAKLALLVRRKKNFHTRVFKFPESNKTAESSNEHRDIKYNYKIRILVFEILMFTLRIEKKKSVK